MMDSAEAVSGCGRVDGGEVEMEHESVSSIAGFATYLGVTGFTYKLFEKTDDIVSKEAKKKTAEWLRGEKSEGLPTRVSRIFSNAFDAVFGTRLLSFRAFFRSCLASLACMLLAFFLWGTLRPGEFLALASDRITFMVDVVLTLLLGAIFNFLPDYLSLIKTRAFIGLLNRTSGLVSSVAILAVDAFFSAGLGLLFFFVGGFVIYASAVSFEGKHVVVSPDWPYIAKVVWNNILLLKKTSDTPVPVGVWFYATFFTSFWLWLSALAVIILRVGQLLAWTRNLFTWAVRIDEKPFKAIGVAALGVETLVFLVLALAMGLRSVMA
jgi:hypothetical protein